MAQQRQRMISTKFWSDSFVVDKLNPLDRYLFLYFLTNERTNLAGVYESPLRTIANETGLEKEEIVRMLERLKGKVEYKDGWVCLVNFTKHQNSENGSIVKGIENRLNELPEEVRAWVTKLRKTAPAPVVDESSTTSEQPNLTKPNLTKPKRNTAVKEVGETIDRFWAIYPEHIAKAKAVESWEKLPQADREKAVIAIKLQVEAFHFRGKDGEDYIPHPATWLNQKRWEDELKKGTLSTSKATKL